jgi:hypothetical protein
MAWRSVSLILDSTLTTLIYILPVTTHKGYECFELTLSVLQCLSTFFDTAMG